MFLFRRLLHFLVTTKRRFLGFFNDPAPTEIYTLSLHDALPIYCTSRAASGGRFQWVLDTVRETGEWLHQPLQFESAALRAVTHKHRLDPGHAGRDPIDAGGVTKCPME